MLREPGDEVGHQALFAGQIPERNADPPGIVGSDSQRVPEARDTGDLPTALGGTGASGSFDAGEIRFHKSRPTYTAARIQTTEHGSPVALSAVAREPGHSPHSG